jgi:ribosomal protein S18 acetylase RimI-like enzyme
MNLPPGYALAPLSAADFAEAMALWNSCEGVRANETPDEFARILARNPGLSGAIRRGSELAAAVLTCHDGRRGYLYHLGVAAAHRKLGLGRLLVEHSLAQLRAIGIRRCTIFLIASNDGGEAFWKRIGWRDRDDLKVLAYDL